MPVNILPMKQAKHKEPNSVQKVIFFCLFVLLLIGISLGIRLVTLIRSSTFDGDHRYTIEIKKSNTEAKVISIDPANKKTVVLYITGKTALPKLDLIVGLPIDQVVTHPTTPDKSITSDLSDLLFNLHVNGYDMLRLITASKTIPSGDVTHLSYTYPFSEDAFDEKTADLVIDSGVTHDNQTVSISNASDISGFGNRFGRLIERAGGTVIAVNSSAASQQTTTLTYYGDKTYTVKKLERLLRITGVQKEGKVLSDIVITLGKDQEKEVLQ